MLLAAVPGAATQPPALSDADTLKLVMQDTRMTVPVRIGAAGPWPFVIDTGAQRTVISRELANVLKLASGPDVALVAMTGTSRVPTALIPSLSVSVVGGEQIAAPALAARDLGALGLLGIDTLQGHKVSIDFTAQTMALSPSARRARRSEARSPDEVVVRARDYLGQLVVTDARYRGHQVSIVLDTGSPVSIGNAALRRLAGRSTLTPIAMTSVTGQQLHADYTQIGEVELGGLRILNLPVAFADAAPFRQFKLVKRPALLLGMDALGLFTRVDIDFPNRELRLMRPRNPSRF